MDTNYFDQSKQGFLINYRITNSTGLRRELMTNGIETVRIVEMLIMGNLGGCIDCDDRRVKLWKFSKEHLFEK
jgi:hypothetical protein